MKKTSLLLMVGDDGAGQMIVDGKCYMVRSTWTEESWTFGGSEPPASKWKVHVTSVASLDEEAQRRRIEGLERELAREKERLSDIRTALVGDEDPES